MYATLLFLHSLLRWVVVILLLVSIIRGFTGWKGNRNFTSSDGKLRLYTVLSAHLQFVIGLILYFVSPTIQYFMQNFKDAMSQAEVRFFGMEHTVMMILAIVILTIGGAKVKRATSHNAKFKTMAIWFLIALIIMVISIPWFLSPMAPERPLFRGF